MNSLKGFFISAIIYNFLLVPPTSSQGVEALKFTRLTGLGHPKYIGNYSYKLKPISRYKSLINIDGNLIRPVRNVYLKFQSFRKYNTYQPFIVNLAISNACTIMSGKSIDPIKMFIFDLLVKYTNLNHSCPYTPGHYFAKDLDFYPFNHVKVPLPAGKYMGLIQVYEGNFEDEIFTIRGFADAIESINKGKSK